MLGVGGLVAMLGPLVTLKGSALHRRLGWVFVACMGGASATAVALAAMRLWQGSSAGTLDLRSAAFSIFLMNVAVLTGVSMWHGLRVLGQKKRTTWSRNVLDIGMSAVLVLVSAGVLWVAAKTGVAVLFTLPIVGLVLGTRQLWELLTTPRDRMFWWFSHMGGMIGGCIAAATAALVVNTNAVQGVIAVPGWALWIAPTVVGVGGLAVWMRRYRRQFAGRG